MLERTNNDLVILAGIAKDEKIDATIRMFAIAAMGE